MPSDVMPAEEVETRLKNLDVAADDDEEVDEVEEDPRISTLLRAADKLTTAEFVAKLDELGTQSAIVLGGMCTDSELARAHFVVMSQLDVDEDQTLSASMEEKRAVLKACCAGGGATRFAAFLAALESFVCHLEEAEVRKVNIAQWDQALKVCWEWELVDEGAIRAWQEDERAARNLQVTTADARQLRERGQAFLEWVDAGED
uniref:W2 domain-containing protein n=1 Tax=Haptolina brevifila TaxID=156173 RepID=A0A6U7INA4_9EUKA|mmetsp:Transcript_59533/g.118287  ORF Transcript_59533/g.118287 Transcript_59533/m.118287 type:complete len:203 (+) Transcript_59533:37-645(+)